MKFTYFRERTKLNILAPELDIVVIIIYIIILIINLLRQIRLIDIYIIIHLSINLIHQSVIPERLIGLIRLGNRYLG